LVKEGGVFEEECVRYPRRDKQAGQNELSGVAKWMLAGEVPSFFWPPLAFMMKHIYYRFPNMIPHVFTSWLRWMTSGRCRQPEPQEATVSLFPFPGLFRGQDGIQLATGVLDLCFQSWLNLFAQGVKRHLPLEDDLPYTEDLVIRQVERLIHPPGDAFSDRLRTLEESLESGGGDLEGQTTANHSA